MSRGSCLLLVGLALTALGCRASADDCRDLALHLTELAQAQGKSGATVADDLEAACNEQRPTRGVVACMMGAQSLAELEGC